MITVVAKKPGVNTDILADELLSALGSASWSMSVDGDQVTITVPDDRALADTAETVISAHPTKVESSIAKADRLEAEARAALSVQNFKQIRADIQAAASLAALRPILLSMLRVLYYLAAAARLNSDDPNA